MKRSIIILCLTTVLLLSFFVGCMGIDNPTNNHVSNNIDIADTQIESESDGKETFLQESVSDTEIINSVLSSLDRSFNNGDGYTYYNFIDDNIGFFFNVGGADNRLRIFMKTSDGGRNWYMQTVVSGPSMHWKEKIICAKMITEEVGLISGKFYADSDIRNRTYITSDGGLTWYAPEVNRNILCCAEAYDMVFQNEEYILCFREKYLSDGSYEYKYYKCSSKDLQTWTLIEE